MARERDQLHGLGAWEWIVQKIDGNAVGSRKAGEKLITEAHPERTRND